MSRESDFIRLLRRFAHDPAARGLQDDCAVLPIGDRDLVLTHDMLVEGVHYLADDPPEDIAWKLLAVNLSDLAAKGARPIGALMGYMLGRDVDWDARFAGGLEQALAHFAVPLLGGDTVRAGDGARALGLTAIGTVAPGGAPSRAGALSGDALWITGRIGAAGIGLAIARGDRDGPAAALTAYRRPMPRLDEGRALAPLVNAMADVSDGVLIDARRMAEASGLAVEIDLESLPLAEGCVDRLAAAVAGDDYELIFAAPPGLIIPQALVATVSRIGRFREGGGITVTGMGGAIPLPASLGYEHE